MGQHVFVAGSFVADLAFRAARLPSRGETLMGNSFVIGPGGKGSNQAVAAARAGAAVRLFSKVGNDPFGKLAHDTWRTTGIDTTLVGESETGTGAAAILVDEASGENAIIVVPGACFTLTPAEMEAAADAITSAAAFLTQLEIPLTTVQRGLEIAHSAGVPTILNPAPAPTVPLPNALMAVTDFLIPNESEAALLTGLPIDALASGDRDQAEQIADSLLARGAGTVILTLGARGSLLRRRHRQSTWIPAYDAGTALDTTGAGDAFCGAFTAALAAGELLETAARFASAAAGIAVTRAGTAASMPTESEIRARLAQA